MNKGFTLIELLVVVGILAVLAVAALIAINPLEAQRRTRDSARLQDMARLSSAVEAFINDNGTTGIPAEVHTAGTDRSEDCASNWTTLDLCDVLKQVPQDPQNGRTSSIVENVDGDRSTTDPTMGYGFSYSAGDYAFCTFLESNKNAELLNDGQDDNNFDTGTDVTNITCDPQ